MFLDICFTRFVEFFCFVFRVSKIGNWVTFFCVVCVLWLDVHCWWCKRYYGLCKLRLHTHDKYRLVVNILFRFSLIFWFTVWIAFVLFVLFCLVADVYIQYVQ